VPNPADATPAWTPVHRIVLPPPWAPDGVGPLYGADGVRAAGRSTLTVEAGTTGSLDTYVNGLPAAYWREHAGVTDLQLRARVAGAGTVLVRARGADGAVRAVARAVVDGDGELCLPASLAHGDVWLWLELHAGAADLELREAAWWACTRAPRAAIGVGITTFDRPDDCLRVLQALAGETEVVRIVVVDQGSRTVRSQVGFDAVSRALGERLRLLTQPNLGGAGGFARAMTELLSDPSVEQICLLDDDVVLEPEALRRLGVFSAVAGDHAVVGGQMIKLTDPTVLHTTGEVVEPFRFWWRAAPGAATELDLAAGPASALAPLSRLTAVDFNGWWMCVLPRPVVSRLGLPLPVFIKWDDVEYGLRARDEGFGVVTLPGAGLWHMPWTAKDTSRDWQAFFLARNRLVAASLHGRRGPLGLVLHLAAQTLGHVVSMAYSAADLTQTGVEEFLRGPDRLWEVQRQGLRLPQQVRARHVDADADAAATEAARATGASASTMAAPPTSGAAVALAAAGAVARALVPVPGSRRSRAVVRLDLSQARWPVLSRLDRVLVASPDGRPSSLRVRNRRTAWRLVGRTARNGAAVLVRWRSLRRDYLARQRDLTAADRWHTLFEAASRKAASDGPTSPSSARR
jgi:galactofuranosylgalactofuranosylrhamnosyl-N-acetylglucosaminyl-diphospho-decaprenol beta-1,5/1,6-galactofuranosyltransferase